MNKTQTPAAKTYRSTKRNKNFTNIYNSGQSKTNVARKARRSKTPQMRSGWKDREGFLGKVASERDTDNWRRKKEAAAHHS